MATVKSVVVDKNGKPASAAWRFVGAMFSEDKNGIQAISLHRILAFILFVACLCLWLASEKGVVHDSMLHTLWGLLGINGAHKVVSALRPKPVIQGELIAPVMRETRDFGPGPEPES